MNSDRRLQALALLALTAVGCASPQGPQPPSFPSGGLLASATPPPNPWSATNVLEGVYDTSSRFGTDVVVHVSQWGDGDGGVQASVSLLAYDHLAFAILQPGCLTDTTTSPSSTQLVLEGYWRYLDDPNPSPSTNGLIRLFVGPEEVVDYVCDAPAWGSTDPPGDSRPPPGAPVTLSGSTGPGNAEPTDPLTATWLRARKSRSNADGTQTFFVGAHRGGCQTVDNCGVSENTPEAAILGTQLGSDYLEVDVALTADDVPVVFHVDLDPALVQGVYCVGSVGDWTYDQLVANCRLRNGEIIPRADTMLDEVMRRTDKPIYLDTKGASAIVPLSQILETLGDQLVPCNPPPADASAPWPPAGKQCLFPGSAPVWQRGIIGLPNSEMVTAYIDALDAGELAPNQHCLVEESASDVTDVPCVAWMPRYALGPQTSAAQPLQQQGVFFGFWTMSDPATIDAFLTEANPNGILTNYPGLLNQRFEEVGTPPPDAPFLISTP